MRYMCNRSKFHATKADGFSTANGEYCHLVISSPISLKKNLCFFSSLISFLIFGYCVSYFVAIDGAWAERLFVNELRRCEGTQSRVQSTRYNLN